MVGIIPLRRDHVVFKFLVIQRVVHRRFAGVRVVQCLGDRRQVVGFSFASLVGVFLQTRHVHVFVVVQSASTRRGHFRIRTFARFLPVVVRAPYRARTPMVKVSGSLCSVRSVTF